MRINLQYSGHCVYKEKIWFSCASFHGLFSVDKNTFSVKYIGKNPNLKSNLIWPYTVFFEYMGRLFFFPNNHNQIVVYDTKNQKIVPIMIPDLGDNSIYITNLVIRKENKAIVIPVDVNNGVYILDLSTLKIKKEIKLTTLLSDIKKTNCMIHLSQNVISILTVDNGIIEVDIEKKEIQRTLVIPKEIDVFAIRHDGVNYWLLPRKSTTIYEWNVEKDEFTEYTLKEAEWRGKPSVPYSEIIFSHGQIIVLPSTLKNIMKINKDTRLIEKAVDYPPECKYMNNQLSGMPTLTSGSFIDGKLWLYPISFNMLLIYDLENNIIDGHEITIETSQIPEFADDYDWAVLAHNGILSTVDDNQAAEILLGYMKTQKKENQKEEIEENVGEKIHNCII